MKRIFSKCLALLLALLIFAVDSREIQTLAAELVPQVQAVLEGLYEDTSTYLLESNEDSRLVYDVSEYIEDESLLLQADDTELESSYSGTLENDITWYLDTESGVLTISGEGTTANYTYGTSPFYEYRRFITEIVVEEGITSLGYYFFAFLSCAKSVTLPSTLISINFCAFRSCALTTIEIPDSVKYIYESAFLDCTSLQQCKLSENLNTLYLNSFYNCIALESLYIPASVTQLLLYPEKCTSMTEIEVASDNAKFCSYEGCLYNKSMTTLYYVPAGYDCTVFYIPDTVTCVYQGAFNYSRKIRKIICPESLQSIYANAFANTLLLSTIVFQGDAPTLSSASGLFKGSIVAYAPISTTEGWEDFATLCEGYSYSITWVDSSSYPSDGIQLTIEDTYMRLGSMLQVYAYIDPVIDTEFEWKSSNTDVIVVTENGMIYAVSPGTAQIIVQTKSGAYSSSVNITVVGENVNIVDEGIYELPYELIAYTSNQVTQEYSCEKLNGIYFLVGTNLYFYSLVSNEYCLAYTFYAISSAYLHENLLYVVKYQNIYVFNLDTMSLDSTITVSGYTSANAIGVDSLGRIYIGTSDSIYLYNEEGVLLSSVETDVAVYEFSGFESATGFFYYEAGLESSYWGMALTGVKMGIVVNDQIKLYSISSQVYISSMYWQFDTIQLVGMQYNSYDHQRNSIVLNDKYLLVQNNVMNTLNIFVATPDDPETEENEFSIDKFIRKDRIAYEGTSSAVPSVTSWYLDIDTLSIGVRAVYFEENNSFIAYMNDNTLAEYSLDDGSLLAEYETQHPVFNLFTYQDKLIAIELEDSTYYLEVIDWQATTSLSLTIENDTLFVGESTQITAEFDSSSTPTLYWESSDPTVASVMSNGKVIAWGTGTATITCTTSNGVSATIEITVKSYDITLGSSVSVFGTITSNVSDNNYVVYASVVNSYVYQNDNGTLIRAEYISGTGLVVETYSSSYELQSSKTITNPLSLWGGLYFGEDHIYIVWGQGNANDCDDVEVMRVEKYSYTFSKIASQSIYGANTYIPFDAGSLRMTETDSSLYIYTCHTMYTSSDGYHHQANMTFVLNKATLEIEDSFYKIYYPSIGYVSHSCYQFILSYGESIYRIDHGDAYPRGIYLSKCSIGDSITSVSYDTVYEINSPPNSTTVSNATGVSIGGFALSSENCIIVGNSVDMTDEDTYNVNGQRNIFVLIVSQDLTTKSAIFLTDYNANITVRTPQLIQIDTDQFLIMWEEVNASGNITLKAVTIDGEGTQTSKIVSLDYRLSDCQPILTEEGLIMWYVTDGQEMTFYTINPYYLESESTQSNETDTTTLLKGTSNEKITKTALVGQEFTFGEANIVEYTISDESIISIEGRVLYAIGEGEASVTLTLADGNTYTVKFTVSEALLGDVNLDGIVNASDASEVLVYCAKVGAGENVSFYDEKWIERADYDGDGTINASDGSAILTYAALVGAN